MNIGGLTFSGMVSGASFKDLDILEDNDFSIENLEEEERLKTEAISKKTFRCNAVVRTLSGETLQKKLDFLLGLRKQK